MTKDILDLLRADPGLFTLGQLLQQRQQALHEIEKLRQLGTRLQPAARHPPVLPHAPVAPPRSLLKLRQVCDELSLSRSTVYARMKEGTFPRPVSIGPRSVRWTRESISEWTEGQVQR